VGPGLSDPQWALLSGEGATLGAFVVGNFPQGVVFDGLRVVP
jgi:hypothetical protein